MKTIIDIDHLADDSIFKVYKEAAKNFPSGSTFVELGCYKGGSAVYLAHRIKDLNKDIKIYAVDIWDNKIAPGAYGSIFYKFWQNVIDAECEQMIRPIHFDSRKTAFAFDDQSVDFVFVDADHRYEFVKADILNWLPKIKEHGWIAGHDFNQEVEKAVYDIFKKEQVEKISGGCTSFLVRL